MIENLTHDRVKEVLHYDPETGKFIWTAKRMGRSASGKLAGSVRPDGYLAIQIDGVLCFAHRLAWFYTHGEWPDNHIDHINRVRTDNRINNLRVASDKLNQQNRSVSKNNRSGISGIRWVGERNKWEVQIKHNRKPRYIGRYTNLADAKLAREIAEIFFWRTA